MRSLYKFRGSDIAEILKFDNHQVAAFLPALTTSCGLVTRSLCATKFFSEKRVQIFWIFHPSAFLADLGRSHQGTRPSCQRPLRLVRFAANRLLEVLKRRARFLITVLRLNAA